MMELTVTTNGRTETVMQFALDMAYTAGVYGLDYKANWQRSWFTTNARFVFTGEDIKIKAMTMSVEEMGEKYRLPIR